LRDAFCGNTVIVAGGRIVLDGKRGLVYAPRLSGILGFRDALRANTVTVAGGGGELCLTESGDWYMRRSNFFLFYEN